MKLLWENKITNIWKLIIYRITKFNKANSNNFIFDKLIKKFVLLFLKSYGLMKVELKDKKIRKRKDQFM